MEDKRAPQMQATLGLTGLTSNAMALIAPGAFLWLTFYIQANTGSTAPTMWLGIVAAQLLCLATAVAYAEISKLYPAPVPATITPSRRCFPKMNFSNTRAWSSSSSAGARISIIGSIPA